MGPIANRWTRLTTSGIRTGNHADIQNNIGLQGDLIVAYHRIEQRRHPPVQSQSAAAGVEPRLGPEQKAS